jgi:hypothetical protein
MFQIIGARAEFDRALIQERVSATSKKLSKMSGLVIQFRYEDRSRQVAVVSFCFSIMGMVGDTITRTARSQHKRKPQGAAAKRLSTAALIARSTLLCEWELWSIQREHRSHTASKDP